MTIDPSLPVHVRCCRCFSKLHEKLRKITLQDHGSGLAEFCRTEFITSTDEHLKRRLRLSVYGLCCALETERRRLHEAHLRTADLRAAMEAAGLAPAAEGGIAEELLRRPEISYPLVAGIIGWGEEITPMLAERLETEIKYAGYIARQDRMIREVARHEKTLIPEDFEYAALTGLTLEAREKLARIRPRNLGQAGRIPGVSPSDVAQLSIALAGKQQK